MRNWCWAGVLLLLALPACTPQIPPSVAEAGTPSAAASPSNIDVAAVTEWRRSVDAQQNVPLQGRVAVTHWAGGREQERLIDFVEGVGGKYRFTYVQPENVRGRVILSDGKTVWQYEPAQGVILERPATESSDPLRTEHLPEDHAVALNATAGQVAGRAVRVLEVRMAGEKQTRERFWVDTETGRTLKVEEAGTDGRLIRRAEVITVTFPERVAEETFLPDFPADARRISANSGAGRDATLRANLLGLPKQVNRYRVRSVIASEKPGARQQALYADGVHTVSLFVTPLPEGKKDAGYRDGPGWDSATLEDGTTVWTRKDDSEGKAAALWSKDGRQFVVVGRLPRKSLLTFVNALLIQSQLLTSR